MAVAFDDISTEQLAHASGRVAAAALHAARLAAAERLVAGPASSVVDAGAAVEILLTRDPEDSRYELLRAFEKAWSVLVIRILAPVADPTEALRDARDRGVTVAAIATALGITPQGVYARYADAVRRPPPSD